MKALRVPVNTLEIGEHALDVHASHYVLRVHRMQLGAALVLCDVGRALEATATLIAVVNKAAICRIERVSPTASLPTFEVMLLQGLAKGDKLDRVIRDATALGASRIVMVATERSVVRCDADESPSRLGRWQRIAVESARQCGRGNVPEIVGPHSLRAALDLIPDVCLKLALMPNAVQPLAVLLRQRSPQAVALFIGPEGGFASREEQDLLDNGFHPVRFGSFTLRTETAATAVLGAFVDWCIVDE